MAECRCSSTVNDEVSGQMKAIFCQPCLKKDKQTKAEKYCSTCDEFQCMDCLKVHYTYAFMKGHKIVNVNEQERKQISLDMKGLDQCYQHQKVIEFFCEDENKLCCSTCAIVDHRKCNSVIDIQKVVGKSASTGSSLNVKLQKFKQKAEITISNVVSSKEKLYEDVKEIPVKIRRMRDDVINMFDELEVSIVKDAESFQTETLVKLTKKQSQNEKYLADIEYCLEAIDSVHKNGNLVQQFIIEHKMQKEVNVLLTKFDQDCQDLETVTVTFDFDDTLKLPPLPISDHIPGQLSFKSHLSEATSTLYPNITTMKLTPVISVDLKQSKDCEREPYHRGIDFLPDGRLVAVDNYNKKCFLYDENLDKVGSYQLSYAPLSVVALSDQEVAVTSSTAYNLDILHVDKSNQITLDRTYKVKTKYDSICLKDGGHFVVGTVNHSTAVRILSFLGKEKDFNINFPSKTYPIDTSACTYIMSSNKVVLTDRVEHNVYIYDVKTNTRVVVKDDQIKQPFGAAVGPSDTILVCSVRTNSIVRISQTGRILSSYKIDMTLPLSICVSRDKSFLIVTNGNRKLEKLKISY